MHVEVAHHVELFRKPPRAARVGAHKVFAVLVLGGDVLLEVPVHGKSLAAGLVRACECSACARAAGAWAALVARRQRRQGEFIEAKSGKFVGAQLVRAQQCARRR